MSAVAADLTKSRHVKNDVVLSKEIPYVGHLDKATITTTGRDYIQLIKLSGISFLSADDIQVNAWHRSLNNTLRNIASAFPNIAFWSHLDRHEQSDYPEGESDNPFVNSLDEKYAARVTSQKMKVNDLYLSVVFRPQKNMFTKKMFDILMGKDEAGLDSERTRNLQIINKAVDEVLIALKRYDAERLTVYKHNGLNFSQPLEFYSYLVSGERKRFPIGKTPAKFLMNTSRLFFGSETLEIRTPDKTILAAMLGIKEYPEETMPGIFNDLLSANFEFVLTQSFTFIARETARSKLKLTKRRMKSADDDAQELAEQIDFALNDLATNRFVMGQHHFTLMVKAESQDELLDNVSKARSYLGDTGMVTAREDLALESAYWSQLPANFSYRPRVAAITSRNFSGFSPFHNFPSGRKSGNHWGNALTLLATAAGTPLYFSYHASDPSDDPDASTKKDVGHTLIFGPNGSGKTVFVDMSIAMMQKFDATTIMFTKDNDSEILIHALGGQYNSIERGKATHWQPFQMPLTEANRAFLKDLTLKLATRTTPLTRQQEKDVFYAVDRVLSLEPHERRLGRVLDYLDATEEEGPYAALTKWCYAHQLGDSDGENAWVFDNLHDEFMVNFGEIKTVGFDISSFLDVPELRTPICMYLFHLVENLIDGRRLVIHLAEFWKLLADPYFEDFGKNKLKTIRKLNGMVILDTQSPSDALNSPIARTLIEQTATKIFFPDPSAVRSQYTSDENGMNLSDREYELISEEIPEGSRMFLVKQSHGSVVAKLDLKGMDNELAVLSARKTNVDIVRNLIEEYGNNPSKWLPIFYERKRSE